MAVVGDSIVNHRRLPVAPSPNRAPRVIEGSYSLAAKAATRIMRCRVERSHCAAAALAATASPGPASPD